MNGETAARGDDQARSERRRCRRQNRQQQKEADERDGQAGQETNGRIHRVRWLLELFDDLIEKKTFLDRQLR